MRFIKYIFVLLGVLFVTNAKGQLVEDPNATCSPNYENFPVEKGFVATEDEHAIMVNVHDVTTNDDIYQLPLSARWIYPDPTGVYAVNKAFKYTGASSNIRFSWVYNKPIFQAKRFKDFKFTKVTVTDITNNVVVDEIVDFSLHDYTFTPLPSRIYQFKAALSYWWRDKIGADWQEVSDQVAIVYVCMESLASGFELSGTNYCYREQITVAEGFVDDTNYRTYYSIGEFGEKIRLTDDKLDLYSRDYSSSQLEVHFWRYDIAGGFYYDSDVYTVNFPNLPNPPLFDEAQVCGYQTGAITLEAQAQNGELVYWLTNPNEVPPYDGHQGNTLTLPEAPYGRHWVTSYDPNTLCYSEPIPAMIKNCYKGFALKKNKDYMVSAWVSNKNFYKSNYDVEGHIEVMFLDENDNILSSLPMQPVRKAGIWEKIEAKVKTPSNAKKIRLVVTNDHQVATMSIDDIRIHPLDTEMVSYTYEPDKLRLSAQLDRDNMATFYGYNDEGKLIKTNVETYKGRRTLMETRVNIAKQQ